MMFEGLSRGIVVSSTVIGIAVLPSAASVDLVGTDQAMQLEPCFDFPLDIPPISTNEPEAVSIPMEGDQSSPDDPQQSSDRVAGLVTNALVEITDGDSKGTGFVTTASNGKQVVLTAGHVVGTSFNKLSITTDDGRTTKPVAGCYIFNNGDSAVSLSHSADSGIPADTDIAALVLDAPLVRRPLHVSDQEASAGAWGFFINYQANHGPKSGGTSIDYLNNPANLSGIVAPSPADSPSRAVINDAQVGTYDDYSQTYIHNQVEPGASGGPFVNKYGDVVGMSVAVKGMDMYDLNTGKVDLNLIKHIYGVDVTDLNPEDKAGLQPIAVAAIRTYVMRMVLGSPILLEKTKATA